MITGAGSCVKIYSLSLNDTNVCICRFYFTPNRGIGLESSILFALEGANVVLADINLQAAEKTAALIAKKAPNAKAIAVKADVGKEQDVKAIVDKAVSEFGRIDVIVRNLYNVVV